MCNKNSIAIGNFDGFHLGHIKIVNALKEISNNNNIITFSPHPYVGMGLQTSYEITPIEHKIELIKQNGFKAPLILDFNQISHLSAEEFIKTYLKEDLNVNNLVFGQDFKMGADKKNANQIKEIASKYDIFCHIIERDERYSSTIVRNLLKEGKIQEANAVLGRNFCIKGKVVKGMGLGSQIGFATANIDPNVYVIPKFGVYRVVLTNNATNKKHNAICNIGVRPTVDDSKKILLEVHIFDFSDDICNNMVSVEFIDFIRQEKKFESVDELINQINLDCIKVKDIFAKE